MGKIVKYPESNLQREIEQDGFKITFAVYKGDEGGWTLEFVDGRWNSTVWDELFPSAKEAIDAGYKVIEEQGIQAFIGDATA